MTASSITRLERSFLALALSLALSAWMAVLLAELGLLRPTTFTAAAVSAGALAIVGLRRLEALGRSPDRASGARHGARQGLAAAGVLVFCAAIFFPPYETFLWASDSTVYLNLGAEISQNDGYELRDPLLAEIAPPMRAEIFRNPVALDATGPYVRLPGGFGIPEIEEPTVVAGFSPVFPALLSVVYDSLGLRAMPWVAPVVAILGMFALFLVGCRVGGTVAGVGATTLAAVAMPQIWFAKFPMPEIVAELFVLAALLALSMSSESERPLLGGVAGCLFGIAALGRFELFPIVTISLTAFIGARLLWTGRGPGRVFLWMACAFAVTMMHAVYHYLSLPTHYTLFIQQEISSNYAARAIQWLGWERVGLLAGLVGVTAIIALSRIGDGLRATLSRPRWWGSAMLLAVGTYFINDSSTYVFPSNPTGLWAGLQETIGSLRMYLTLPFGLTLALAGTTAAVLSWRARKAELRAPRGSIDGESRAPTGAAASGEMLTFVVVLVLAACMHMHRSPDPDEHIWTMRRFVPVVIPGLALLTASLTATTLRRLNPRRGSLGATIVLVLLTTIVALPSAAIIGQPLWHGTLEASSDIAALLPEGSIVLMSVDLAGTHLATTLNYIHDVRTIVLSPALIAPPLLGELVADWIEDGRPIFAITSERVFSFYAPDLSLDEVDRRILAVPVMERTRGRTPRRVVNDQVPLTIARLRPRGEAATLIDIGNLADDVFFRLLGFHAEELDLGQPDASFRWTMGGAGISIPPVRAVRLTLSGARPDGVPPARVSVSVDGVLVLDNFEISNELMEVVVDLPAAEAPAHQAIGRNAETPPLSTPPRNLVITSTSFRPAHDSDSTDERLLGVRLYGVELVGPPARIGEKQNR